MHIQVSFIYSLVTGRSLCTLTGHFIIFAGHLSSIVTTTRARVCSFMKNIFEALPLLNILPINYYHRVS
ncbi:hypothetical protein BDV33DRAFT_181995 [Aspergillus novoparasiticus]|uniref:Uncharacterized protein n=1 Tax=Aspergillus novoparasiticus TaxID=986946 RepID=A0A5N6EB50_9EURO|nr:hypothetical protein BDV33DRAFT_181995 [Aspergillus novoparasiticus]